MRLAEMTYWQAESYFQEHDCVILTIGCLESHGSHNVLGVDTLIPGKSFCLWSKSGPQWLLRREFPMAYART